MKVTFDPTRSERNALERGLPFQLVDEFDFDTAIIRQDVRRLYPGRRLVVTGYLGSRLHVVCYTPTADGIRVISFRKANAREIRAHVENTA